jgi:hypothetical protein
METPRIVKQTAAPATLDPDVQYPVDGNTGRSARMAVRHSASARYLLRFLGDTLIADAKHGFLDRNGGNMLAIAEIVYEASSKIYDAEEFLGSAFGVEAD